MKAAGFTDLHLPSTSLTGQCHDPMSTNGFAAFAKTKKIIVNIHKPPKRPRIARLRSTITVLASSVPALDAILNRQLLGRVRGLGQHSNHPQVTGFTDGENENLPKQNQGSDAVLDC